MNSEAHFLEAIQANPDDDTLRLVYADWLEERGDPRGEFIRVQYELEKPRLDAKRRAQLTFREKELQGLHGEKWLGPLAEFRDFIEFRRGFPAGARMHVKVFLDNAELIFQSFPVNSLDLDLGYSWSEAGIPSLVECAHLRSVSRLALRWHVGNTGMRLLADCPWLAGLKELLLFDSEFELNGIRALAAGAQFAGLKCLVLDTVRIGDLGLHAICACRHLQGLEVLAVRHGEMTSSAIRYLTTSSALPRLTWLDLAGNRIGNTGLRALISSPTVARLQRLELTATGIDSLGVHALAASRHVAGLRELKLSSNTISPVGIEALADSPHLANLTDLWLQNVPLNDDARKALKQRFKCTVHF